MEEPILRVGLIQETQQACFELRGRFDVQVDGMPCGLGPEGVRLTARAADGCIRLVGVGGELCEPGQLLRFVPRDPMDSSFLLLGMTVGVHFHWQHEEDLRFRGGLTLLVDDGAMHVIDEVPLEQYLVSVISSEMSARCPDALLRAHAVISRSWMLAQLQNTASAMAARDQEMGRREQDGVLHIHRWYDREDHALFDVCADDHCQRYQGITRAFSAEAVAAVEATRGLVLVHDGEVCDARFSKCCGGMTEVYAAAWGDEDVPYLQAFHDGEGERAFALPLTDELNAVAFIEGGPPAFCNAADPALMARLLPELDHETMDFYRWETTIRQQDLRAWVTEKAGVDPGPIRALEPLERGPSGRLVKLAIRGMDRDLVVGKELEIRRLLSDTHLYSSAFVVQPGQMSNGVPLEFKLRGAGWGHGVGLCQIGAAVMADQGRTHREILAHYYRGADLQILY